MIAMAETIERKCAKCKDKIVITQYNIDDVVSHKGKYYHLCCFETMATEKAASKRGKPTEWQEALDNLPTIKKETRNMIEHSWAKVDLNIWLLNHYDISSVPGRFWQMIAELEQGKYKGKRCKPIDIKTILGAWQWGQRKLNEIALTNKKNNKGPQNDSDRIAYDLAILVQKVPQFLAYQERQKAKAIEDKRVAAENETKIDYSAIAKMVSAQKNNTKTKDISSIIDDIF